MTAETSDTRPLNARGRGLAVGDKGHNGAGWGHISAASPTLVGKPLYWPVVTGAASVIDTSATQLNGDALVAVNEISAAARKPGLWRRSVVHAHYARGGLHRGGQSVVEKCHLIPFLHPGLKLEASAAVASIVSIASIGGAKDWQIRLVKFAGTPTTLTQARPASIINREEAPVVAVVCPPPLLLANGQRRSSALSPPLRTPSAATAAKSKQKKLINKWHNSELLDSLF